VNSPSTLLNGPTVEPQNEQCPAIRLLAGSCRGPWASAGDVAAADPAVGVRAKLPLELHETPDLGAIDPDIGFDVGGRLPDGGEIDTEEFGAALKRGCDWPGEGWVVSLHAR
jgi:hypothetical protein